MRIDTLPTAAVSHLVRSGDLNRHGTLFAGRMSEWVVEAAFIGAPVRGRRPVGPPRRGR